MLWAQTTLWSRENHYSMHAWTGSSFSPQGRSRGIVSRRLQLTNANTRPTYSDYIQVSSVHLTTFSSFPFPFPFPLSVISSYPTLCASISAGVGLPNIHWLPPLCPLEVLPYPPAKETKVSSVITFRVTMQSWYYYKSITGMHTASTLVICQISVKMAIKNSLL